LNKIFARLPDEAGKATLVKDFKLNKLLPEGRDSFRYSGSLTTPPFTEGVQWVVLEEPVEVSEKQIAMSMTLFPEGNSREVQPLNGRTVLTDSDLD
jgi:carbonic anhydrase